jgi:hypothetical protein
MMAHWFGVLGLTLFLLFAYSPQNSANRPLFGFFGAIAIATMTQARRNEHE